MNGGQGGTKEGGSSGRLSLRGLDHPILAHELCRSIAALGESPTLSALDPQLFTTDGTAVGTITGEGEGEGLVAGSWEAKGQDAQVPGRAGPQGENRERIWESGRLS